MQTNGQVHVLAALLPWTEASVRSYEGRKIDMKLAEPLCHSGPCKKGILFRLLSSS
jgi:uncharacterized Fe-S cluster protein YjdI